MNILQWKTSFIKEYWEYKNYLFWLPLIMSVLMIVIPTVSFILKDTSGTQWLELFKNLSMTTDSPQLASAFYKLTMGIFVPFTAVAIIIQLYYFLACLYDEKKDTSIYFWRSLPVADSTTVIVKLLTGMLFIPGILLFAATITLAVFLLAALVLTIVLSIGFDISLWAAWLNAEIISAIFFAWLNLIPGSLWLLPLFAWLMLASVIANKAPFLWAFLPIIALLIIEVVLVNYSLLPDFYLAKSLKEYFAISDELLLQYSNGDFQVSNISVNVLLAKISVVGLFLAAIFLYATYWLRANRSHA
ncbi:hypothetical protein [Thalassotalea profundi]|uniref:ABC transporter permease n=1 Tax=Thalassotalea profundi TaxID=2036687 RepID=A0ABQ3IKU4_9GAMM|nr:hypothetical protein [Thalassotalea profundi]GHE84931.1 hypothetical protein GCM10011501_12290 [Thalassotalea profundi]